MIRCYEAKLSKNLNPRVRSFIMKKMDGEEKYLWN